MTAPATAYLVSRYPGVTHAFIVAEVRAMRAAGVRVETASIRRVDEAEVLSAVDREEHDGTYALLPVGPGRLLRAHARAFARSPSAYGRTLLRALRLAPEGGRARVWQLFYFGESILLWAWLEGQGLHHVHVHHANVSADVAMLACAFANGAGAEPGWTWSLTIHGPTELLDVRGHNLPAKVADAAAVACTSDFARSQVSAFADPADLARVHTVRCGVDVTAFSPSPRREDGDGNEILCVAALSRRKGHGVLLDAVARVRAGGAAPRLTLVGDGPEREQLERRAAELGLGDAVRFAGAVGHDRVGDFYAQADVFCLPSFGEGVPTVLMEAMASGLPVVATNVMGTAELVEDGRSGIVVAPARADLIAEALQRLTGDAALRRRMGDEARARIAEHFELGAAVSALREVMAPLIAH